MSRKDLFSAPRFVAALISVAAMGLFAAPAFAISTGETVTGTSLSELSLTAGTGAVLATNFSPGNTASSTGALTATDTSNSWTLQVKDTASSNAGKMQAVGGPTCTGSDAVLTNPLTVSVTSLLPGVNSAGTVSLSGTNQTVASASNQLLAANLFTTNYSQVIPSGQVMLAGCVYTLTSTYTLQ
jgi:hypothetical protein